MSAQSDTQNVKVGIEQGAERLFVKSGGEIDIEAGGSLKFGGVPFKFARGAAALDGANPTPIATGLTTILGAFTQLRGAVTPGDGTSVLTTDYTGSDGTLNVYGWKNTGGTDPTLAASSGTDAFDWLAFGT
jgi:hypothetical protein